MDRTGADPLLPADPPAIGPYRLLGRLGQGGMGTVYLAEAPTGRLVAVKVVKAEFTIDEGFAVRFHAEVTNARRVASFCTAAVLDNGNADDGRPYMITEYIAGTPLSKQISRYGALEAGTLHGVALGVAAALAAIHVAGLVHRDLKPANVILSMSGPRVIDFGIARALDATQGVTRSGELLGSPGWWAPEQVRGEEITPAADIFAWGCLVAYAGNGRHPYGRGDLMTLASRVLTGRPDLGTLPAPLDRLVRQATEPDPRHRPSAQELLIALVGGDPTGATPPPSRAVPVDPPTLVASEMLNESWEPPANVAAATSAEDPAAAALPAAGPDDRPEGRPDGRPGERPAAERPLSEPVPEEPSPSGRPPSRPQPSPFGRTPSAAGPAASPAPERTLVEGALPQGATGSRGPGGAAEGIGDDDDTNPGLSLPGLALPPRPSPFTAPGSSGTAPSGVAPSSVPPSSVAPAGMAPSGTAPSGTAPSGVAPSAVTPSGVAAARVASPGVAPSGASMGPRNEDTRPSAEGTGATVPSLQPATAAESPRRSRGRKWLVPVLTVLGGLIVTAGVLVMVLPDRTAVRATGVAAVTAPTPTRETDVDRRYTTGDTLDGAQFVVPARPRCGLTSYEDATPDEGRFCVIRWTLVNPGGLPVAVAATPPVLVDDRGGEHDPLPAATPAPGTLAPGGRLDGVLVYDLPPARGPATLKVPISDTTTIEVRL
ncbi:protein kinase domain-containing protein [Sphaerisporangium dianthi]|uniref:Protein kinase n=1 Tax=Sphaerisporangium dianthi TaxID=1436120 RepID=A0ABV9CLR0_9ACTN